MTLPEVRHTPCCNYTFTEGPGPIFWNPYNNAVQCHACGARFDLAQGIEARSDETPLGGSALLGESPVGKADAP